jgi:hypothetical protein
MAVASRVRQRRAPNVVRQHASNNAIPLCLRAKKNDAAPRAARATKLG